MAAMRCLHCIWPWQHAASPHDRCILSSSSCNLRRISYTYINTDIYVCDRSLWHDCTFTATAFTGSPGALKPQQSRFLSAVVFTLKHTLADTLVNISACSGGPLPNQHNVCWKLTLTQPGSIWWNNGEEKQTLAPGELVYIYIYVDYM